MKMNSKICVLISICLMTTIPTGSAFKIFGFDPFNALLGGVDYVLNNATEIPLPKKPKLTLGTIEEAQHYVHFAAATYCDNKQLNDWSCIECRRASPDVKLLTVMTDKWLATQGIITENEVTNEVVVVFRGSVYFMNYVEDFVNMGKGPSPYGEPNIEIHDGFLASTDSVYDDLLPIVSKLYKDKPSRTITLVGHSLGASMALLTYFRLRHDIPDAKYQLFSYGQPRTGNTAFADWFNSQTLKTARVVNGGDIIPHIFPAYLSNAHVQTEFWIHDGQTTICSQKDYEDPNCSNSVDVDDLGAKDHLNYYGTVLGSCTE